MCDWSPVPGQGSRSWLPKHASDEYTLGSLGGVIFLQLRSQKLQGVVAPNVAEIQECVTGALKQGKAVGICRQNMHRDDVLLVHLSASISHLVVLCTVIKTPKLLFIDLSG